MSDGGVLSTMAFLLGALLVLFYVAFPIIVYVLLSDIKRVQKQQLGELRRLNDFFEGRKVEFNEESRH